MMKIHLTISILLIIYNLTAGIIVPSSPYLSKGESKGWTEQDRPEGNFILDIIKKNSAGEDSAVFIATGDGFSMGYSTLRPIEKLKWRNSVVGYGGSSAIAIDKDNNIWMTTAADSFITDENIFLPTGSGVHMSPDSGRTWVHFPQPGITPIQGLTYDMTCDSLGGIWMACFGQSIQKSDDMGQTWRTLTCDQKEWDPFNIMNQRMFAIHITDRDKLWVGTAEGINLCKSYSQPDSVRVWTQFTYSNGLTGNFVTSIASNFNTLENKEYVFAASWLAESSAEVNGISYTNNDGQTWNKCLIGEKIYSFGFHNNDVFACGENGLWKSADSGNYWEKYVINAWSENKKGYVKIDKVYSFLYKNDNQEGKMFVGTGVGLVVSEDDGNTWFMIEAYKPASDSSNDTYAYPNPFSPVKFGEAKFQFRLKESSKVNCLVYNFAMEKVRTLTSSKSFDQGEHYISWDGKDDNGKTAANGVYFYIISSGDGDVWNKIIIFE
ncbi:MAG: hypothetical protein KKD38_00375 [Candidatus Delongbacteria bacterium]|nr:hypothetical protein [Candidatus Delongbacteria bacterium]MCG2760904.1 hypothetical protein [Candidatus Delongbacteria bacterium]